MKIMILSTLLFLAPSILVAQENPNNADEVILQFITVNGYSNNLYIDNISAGNQYSLDVAMISINNIDSDTSYGIGTTSIDINPKVTVSNLGTTNITSPFDVVMLVSPGGYSSNMSVPTLNSGESAVVTFDLLSITPGIPIDITVYSNLVGDEYTANDTLEQYSLVLAGVQRENVLLEEWTNTSCAPCASNNPTIDAFVDANFGTIVPVKYHVWWPGPNDPMYLYNIPEATNRTEYYGVGGVPHVIMGGEVHPVYPYTTPGSLQDAYDTQMSNGTPLEISVTDTRVTGDSIRADVTLNLVAPLPAGNHYLRVMAVERWINYASPPGSNGEADFYDVFRKAYPDIIGTSIPTDAGTYDYSFTYPLDMAVWVDTMIYSIAFVQDDVSKTVWGSAKGRDLPMDVLFEQKIAYAKQVARSNSNNEVPHFLINETDELMGGFNVELFEGSFPPAGWQVINPDGGITYEQYDGANGPTLGGSKSVLMDFYSYSSIGESDTMNTRIFTGLEATDSIKFDYAHAEYPGYGPDRLIVRVSTDGGQTFPITIFDKEGAALATVPDVSSNFVPANSSEWATFTYSLDNILITTFPLAVTVVDGWNMVSMPGLHPVDQNVSTWWSNLTGSVFKFNGGYVATTTAATGEGYWMKNSVAETYNYAAIDIVTHDPIPVLTGWNMIGGYENSAPTAGLTTTPPELISGSVFGYSGGYVTTTNLLPGYGYWIKVTGDGVLNIPPAPLAKSSSELVEYFKEDWGKIIITDNAERSYTLYAVNGEVNLDNYELPPVPPSGMFDIRYGSDRIAEDINSSIQSIEMSGIEYPIKVKVENMSITLQDESGNNINAQLIPGEEITINNSSINKLLITSGEIGAPIEYALEQNYPNPFNPNTTIKFAVPNESNVNLSIFNVLGELVSTLVHEEMIPGYYEYKFDASNLASGVYLYRIKAGDFVETKKMILQK